MIPIYVLICTIEDGILRVPGVMCRPTEGVHYVVSWQQSAGLEAYGNLSVPDGSIAAETALLSRPDVTLTTLAGRGLCRNRNHAIHTALSLMPDPLTDAIMVIADDDERLDADAFSRLRTTYGKFPKADIILMRMRNDTNGSYFKHYPPTYTLYGRRPRYYYPSSWEMTFRSRICHTGLLFDERFGLGAEFLCAGEEEVFMHDAVRRGLCAIIAPVDLGSTSPATTGSKVLDPKVLRSKGGVYGYRFSLIVAWLRALHEALSIGLRYRRNPLRLFRHILDGINYIRKVA